MEIESDDSPGEEAADLIGADMPGRRIIAIGGGKGGVGKSVLAANLGIYLAQLGKHVVLLDADLGGANLHTFLGVERPSVTLGDFFDKRVARIEDCIVPTAIKNLGLISSEGDPLWAANPRPATKNRLISQLREIDADFLICDLPAGSGFIALDFFLVAHVGILVIVPEPTSVENTFRFIKSAFLRRLRDIRALDQLKTDRQFEGGIPSPLDIYESATDPAIKQRVLDEINRFRPRLVVNQPKARADMELGNQLRSAGSRRLGLHIDYLGHLESDDAVWLAVRKRRPLIVEHPESKIAKDIERVARKLLSASDDPKVTPPPPRSLAQLNYYEVLEIEPSASDEEIRRAYRRAKETYSSESMAICGLYGSERLDRVQARIEEAHELLLDSERRRAHDLSLFPEGVPHRPTPPSSAIPAMPPPRTQNREETPTRVALPEPEITSDTEFTGSLLKRIRESRGIELVDIANKSKIGVPHFRAIEDEKWEAMPAIVYLRGFLVEYARYMRLPVEQVTRTFVQRYQKNRKNADD